MVKVGDDVTFPQTGDHFLIYLPATGDYVGEFTRELKPRNHIVEFAAAGNKNYGNRTCDRKVECKVRGFTLNTRGQAQLNFDFLKANVISEVTAPLNKLQVIPVHNAYMIKRDVDIKTLEMVQETKRYKVVFNNRVVDPDSFQSYPYGYTQAELEDVDMENIDILVGLYIKTVFSQKKVCSNDATSS